MALTSNIPNMKIFKRVISNELGKQESDKVQNIAEAKYYDLIQTIDSEIVKTFESVEITRDGIDLEKEGLKGPSSTWTYLINDNPLGDWSERFSKGFWKIARKGFRSL